MHPQECAGVGSQEDGPYVEVNLDLTWAFLPDEPSVNQGNCSPRVLRYCHIARVVTTEPLNGTQP